MQQRRNADTPEKQLLQCEVTDVEKLADHGVGVIEKLKGRERALRPEQAFHRGIGGFAVSKDGDGGFRVEPDPDVPATGFQIGTPPEAMPASGLTPHRNPHQVFRL